MVFKKDLTPIGKKGTVTTHKGKGSAVPPANPMAQMTSRYPKSAPPAPAPAPMAPMPQQMPLPFKEPT